MPTSANLYQLYLFINPDFPSANEKNRPLKWYIGWLYWIDLATLPMMIPLWIRELKEHEFCLKKKRKLKKLMNMKQIGSVKAYQDRTRVELPMSHTISLFFLLFFWEGVSKLRYRTLYVSHDAYCSNYKRQPCFVGRTQKHITSLTNLS